MFYCKTLDPRDYSIFPEMQKVAYIREMLGPHQRPLDHPHRSWEYGLVLHALLENRTKSVLDVGGGGSIFAACAAWFGMDVTIVDPGNYGQLAISQSAQIGKPLPFERTDFMQYNDSRQFDAVTAISVIEHVEDDVHFFQKLASYVKPGGLLALTTDFWPDGAVKLPDGHLRTYNKQRIETLIRSIDGFFTLGDLNYDRAEVNVISYTFASLVLKRAS